MEVFLGGVFILHAIASRWNAVPSAQRSCALSTCVASRIGLLVGSCVAIAWLSRQMRRGEFRKTCYSLHAQDRSRFTRLGHQQTRQPMCVQVVRPHHCQSRCASAIAVERRCAGAVSMRISSAICVMEPTLARPQASKVTLGNVNVEAMRMAHVSRTSSSTSTTLSGASVFAHIAASLAVVR